jgi:outer membrane protein TolC
MKNQRINATNGWAAKAWTVSTLAVLIAASICCLGASAQDASDKTPNPIYSHLPVVTPSLSAYKYKFLLNNKTDSVEVGELPSAGPALDSVSSAPDAAGARTLTLEEAQAQAASANNPLVRLGQLQVEIAKQHRLGVQAMYFPAIGGNLENMHFNKHPGELISAPRLGVTVPVNIVTKDQTALGFTATQPVTPLIAIHQLVKIARADENIARAKAGMPVAEVVSKVEKNYFDLLVAQRELVSVKAEARKVQAKWLVANNSGAPIVSTEQATDMVNAEKTVVLAASKVEELTASLNQLVGLPEGTKLDLVPPQPLVEDASLPQAVEKAMANPEVVEAEQTAIKAHAGSVISKLAYGPTVAIVGGYANQNAINVVLPRDFSYVGFVASIDVFDFGKREHAVKEASAQAEAADLAVQLTKAKVAAGVKSSYLELNRSRELALLARRMVSETRVVEASYRPDDSDVESVRAKMEADMYRAELEYRQAYAKLRALMGTE